MAVLCISDMNGTAHDVADHIRSTGFGELGHEICYQLSIKLRMIRRLKVCISICTDNSVLGELNPVFL